MVNSRRVSISRTPSSTSSSPAKRSWQSPSHLGSAPLRPLDLHPYPRPNRYTRSYRERRSRQISEVGGAPLWTGAERGERAPRELLGSRQPSPCRLPGQGGGPAYISTLSTIHFLTLEHIYPHHPHRRRPHHHGDFARTFPVAFARLHDKGSSGHRHQCTRRPLACSLGMVSSPPFAPPSKRLNRASPPLDPRGVA